MGKQNSKFKPTIPNSSTVTQLTPEEYAELTPPVRVVIETENFSFAANDVHMVECQELVIKASEIADFMKKRFEK